MWVVGLIPTGGTKKNNVNNYREIIDLENKIKSYFDNCDVYFEYGVDKLDVFTISKSHGETFLFDSVSCINSNKKYGLIQILDRLVNNPKIYLVHYEVEWLDKKSETHITNKSWFYGRDLLDILNKFYVNKDRSSIVIFSIDLRPQT